MRWQTNNQTFTQVYQNLAKHGSFKAAIEGTGWLHKARTPVFIEGVLRAVDRNPVTSVRSLVATTERSRIPIHCVHAYISMAAVPNTSGDAFMSYFFNSYY
ncbi:hypothetical protein TNCV_747711 [Trichonephila clavipes]|nr:hypothetical protein TNCV_747711 [Trichonephila clavipes]